MNQGKLMAIPIFYHVSPSDMRHQSNCFEQGFADHEDNPEIVREKVETWRDAFRVGAISGVHVTQHRDEVEVVNEIVRKILRDLPDTMPIDLSNSLVGIESRVDEVKKIMKMDSDEILFIGICMSGIGKTTLAESVYANTKNKFEKSCLIENIKDISKQNDSTDLCKFQQKLLDDILMEKSIRRNIDLVKDILKNVCLYPDRVIKDLENKCLITINLEDNVWMHDLLQQMCWKILDRKHIAIKSHEDVAEVLSHNPEGTHTVEVINLEPDKGEVNDCFITDPLCFSYMRKLIFLRISNVHFPEGLNYLSNDLRILEWYGCSLKSLPSMFGPTRIYELEMCSSQLKTLWKKDLKMPNLRSVNLSFSRDLTEIPELTSASNLVKLNLEGCTSLTRLHESVLLHKKLRYLNLKGCICLESLGRSRMEMEALEALLLSGCSKLEYIPEFGKNMTRLEHLYVDGTRIKKLPENLREMCNLRNLDASRTSIEELSFSIHLLRRLRLLHLNSCLLSFKTGCFLNPSLVTLSSGLKEVDLSYCSLSVVPDGIGLLCHLIALDLSGNEFVFLPSSIGLLSKLRMLCLNNCKKLQSLPKLSLVDEDDYGPRNRFNYHLRTKNIEQLPEAVFEIVGAGSEIPSEGLILECPWIGVAICAVISVHHIDGYMEANHMVTVHIHLGGKDWKIPVPINFLVAETETQIILYWMIIDDRQRIAYSNHWGNFDVSFGVEPDLGGRWGKTIIGFLSLALEQIVVRSRGDNYSYKEMLQQLNDLEAPQSGGFSDNFITMFLSVCRRTFDFLYIIGTALSYKPRFLLDKILPRRLPEKVLAKISSIPIAGNNRWYMKKTHCNRELQISDFYENGILLQELMNKMGVSGYFTKEMTSLIDKLQNNIQKVSSTIQEMSSHADLYSHDIEDAKKHLTSFSELSKDDDIISMLPLFNKN
ncbi:hypothetical protein L1987_08864 [Smallanthus sonchifolius]|uniref:Uncharacterized protein n=1 Tax=Smallanthus sonchifolius TaxID=185202 RepID=A0ACB9JNY6_9ASTR|nr:hypothetical protein L1987_08864 [Smallanthus sonchifolius]